MKRAVFLDRDGVLNPLVWRGGRLRAPLTAEAFRLYPWTAEAVSRLRTAGFLCVIVTNQPEISTGELSLDILAAMHEQLRREAAVDAVYVCTHRDEDRCSCRKPQPGLLLRAAADLGVDLGASFLVGDRWRDIEAGTAAGCATILVAGLAEGDARADYRAANLEDAVTIILNLTGRISMQKVADIIRRARVLVFDFDGTLVDSNSIKWQAFEACFAEFPDRLAEIMAYCRGEHHTVRGEKFQHVSERILGLPYTPEVATELHARFDAASTRQIIGAPEVPGATRFLEAVRGTHLTGLLSSTPHRILLQILSGRGWRDYFRAVRGAPVEKTRWLEAFRRPRGLHATEAVFFGDTQEDADAAHAAGWTFVVVANEKLTADATYWIPDFAGLLAP